jgi:DNA polymerase-3 subunit delta
MSVPSAARAYLLWGDDVITRDETVRNLKSRMLARPAGELNLAEFHAPELVVADLIATCDTLPFLDERRLVVVHGLFGWRPRGQQRRRPESRDEVRGNRDPLEAARTAFADYLPRLAPQTTLVLVEGALSPAQRTEVQARLPSGRAEIRSFPAPQGADFDRWLARRAQRYGGELGPRVNALLREHGPASLQALDQEVAKLVSYAGDRAVSVGDLSELLSGAEIVVFGLLDAIAEGRAGDALVALRRLQRQGQRVEELTPQIIALYRRLLVCRLAVEERLSAAEVQRIHGVRVIEKLRTQARRWDDGRCEQALGRLLEFDRQLKRGEVDAESALELLVADLAALTLSTASRRLND